MLWGLKRLIDSESPRMEVVGSAGTCAQALTLACELLPDMILLDLDLDGQSAIEIVPELLSSCNARVLILTGVREQAVLDLAIMRGASGILRKDVAPDQIIMAIDKTFKGDLWIDRDTLSRVVAGLKKQELVHELNPDQIRESGLTLRERNIIQAVVRGKGAVNKELAQQLFISEHTLRNHLTSIYQKLGLINRLGLYVYAVKNNLDVLPM